MISSIEEFPLKAFGEDPFVRNFPLESNSTANKINKYYKYMGFIIWSRLNKFILNDDVMFVTWWKRPLETTFLLSCCNILSYKF